MGAELLEPIPVFSMPLHAIQVEVPALQFDIRSLPQNGRLRGHFGRKIVKGPSGPYIQNSSMADST
jgi:hypothetical protein